MTQELFVRVASDEDIELARDLTNRSWLSVYPPLIGEQTTRDIITDRHSSELFKRQAKEGLFSVAVSNGRVVGHCHAFEKDGFYVDRLHVDPDLKGRGIGKMLLRHAEAELESGKRIWLDVLKGNEPAMAFYGKVGFHREGETDACGGLAGIPAVIYGKIAGQADQ